MTPKEKAEQLVSKMYLSQFRKRSREEAKLLALIITDEMLNNAGFIWGGSETGLSARDAFREYWNKVKQEIEKL